MENEQSNGIVLNQTSTPTEAAEPASEDMSFEAQMRRLVESDNDGEEEKAEEPREPENEPEEQEEPEPAEELYTEEQFNSLDPFEVDPEKLPGAASSVHKRYMQIYRDEILPELQELRAFKQRVMADVQRAQAQRDPQKDFMNEVRARAKKALGVQELDELNSEHNIELSRQAAQLAGELNIRRQAETEKAQQVQRLNGLRESLRTELADFDDIDRFAKADLTNMPYSKAQKVIADMQSGDPSRIRAVYQMFAQRYAESKKPPAPKQKPETPPKLIGAGGGERTSKTWNYKDFALAGRDDQAKMLIEAGLVDE